MPKGLDVFGRIWQLDGGLQGWGGARGGWPFPYLPLPETNAGEVKGMMDILTEG